MRKLLVFATTLSLGFAFVTACSSRSTPTAPTSATPSAPQVVTILDVTEGLVEVTGGGTGTWNWAGQSFTVPAGGPFNNIRFNWYTFHRAAAAFGTLYLLTEEYVSLPGDLGTSTPGFVARSTTSSEGTYVFDSSVTLTSGKKYWCYADAKGAFAHSFDQDIYAGGDMYVSGHSTVRFRKAQASWRWTPTGYIIPPPGTYIDANFKLQGSPTGGH